MSEQIVLKIGPIRISLRWSGSRVAEWPHKFYLPFVTDGPCDVNLHVHCGELPSYTTDKLLFEARTNRWNLHLSNDRYLIEIFDPRSGRVNRMVLLNQDLTAGDVFVTPDADRPRSRKSSAGEPTWSLPILLRRVGELLVVNRLSRGRGLLVHALGIDDGGRGFLFVGPSGSGKTTLANLYRDCPGVTILSDERAIVSRIGLDFFVSGTPWPGGAMTVSAGSAPLREIFFLEHAGSNVLHPEPPSRLAALLCQQLFLPFWDPPGLTGALRFVDEVIRAIPARRLGFVNDARVIEFLREQTGGSARPLPAGSPRSDGSPCLSR